MIQQSEICKARSLFISRGILNENVISKSIMHSWVRSKLHHISIEFLDESREVRKVNLNHLSLTGKELIKSIRDINATHSVIYLLDEKGQILYTNNHLNINTPKLWSFSEEVIGTSAGGISAHCLQDSKVYGCEHFNQEMIHFITQTLVLTESSSHKKNIILILTPLRYASHHEQLYKELKAHYRKNDEVSLTKEKNKEESPEVVASRNGVHTLNSTKKEDNINKQETSKTNDCKVFTLSIIEKNTISDALKYYNWNLKKTSEALGIGRSTLYRKIKDYALKRP